MVNWGKYIKRTAVRRVVWIVVCTAVYALLSFFQVAHALVYEHQTRTEAYAACQSALSSRTGANPGMEVVQACTLGASGSQPAYVCQLRDASTNVHVGCASFNPQQGYEDFFVYYDDGCPAGAEWREDLGRCFDPEECLNRNDSRDNANRVETFFEGCIDGCMMGPVLPASCSSIIGEPGQLCAARYEYTGASCAIPPPPEPPQDDPAERCVWFGGQAGQGGQAFCKKPDGRECYTIQGGNRAGQQVCWAPGEAGKKVAGDTAMTRAPGPNEPPPPDPPPGESMEKVGDSVTTETTTQTPSGSSTSTTTTRQDRTMYGTDAGGPGAPDHSEGPGGEGSGEGDGEGEGSWSGGNDCSAPPACAGDAIQCGIGLQVWTMRCEGGGGDEFGDWVAEIDGAIAAGDGDGDPDEGEMLEHADPDTWREIRVVDDEGLDDSGFGLDRSCPQLPAVQVGPASLQFNLGPICSFLSALSGLVLALAYFVAAKIIAGVK